MADSNDIEYTIGTGVSDKFVVASGENHITIKLMHSDGYHDGGIEEKDGKGNNGGHGGNGGGQGGGGSGGGGGQSETVRVNIPVILWNSRTTETTLIRDENNPDTKVGTKTTGSFTEGAQYFSYAETGMKVTSPNLPSNIYCYGDDCIYAVNMTYNGQEDLTSAVIEKYILNGTSCEEDLTFTPIDIKDLFEASSYSSAGSLNEIQAITYAEFNNEEYLFVGFYQYNDKNNQWLSRCGTVSIDNPDKIYTISTGQQPGAVSAIAATSITIGDDEFLYLYYLQGMNLRYMKVDEIGGTSWPDTLNANGARANYSTINLASQLENTLEISSYARPGDLKLINKTLYIALYAYTEGYTLFYFETDNPDSEPNGKPLIISNGGIAKIADITANTPVFADWNNGKKVLGWYKGDYYTGVYTRAAAHDTIYPPLALADKYFYGARKFISNSTEKLVIADDGVIIMAESEVLGSPNMATISSTNMNRVVVLDPNSEQMTVINVDAAFDASAHLGSSDFGIADN